jgi:hypothetical protein
MSGGSYNYLCYKESYDIHERKEELNEMRDRLIELGFADVAGETESVLLMLKSFEVRLQTRIDRLKGVWRAVEWMDSGDSGIEYVEDSVNKYREL